MPYLTRRIAIHHGGCVVGAGGTGTGAQGRCVYCLPDVIASDQSANDAAAKEETPKKKEEEKFAKVKEGGCGQEERRGEACEGEGEGRSGASQEGES